VVEVFAKFVESGRQIPDVRLRESDPQPEAPANAGGAPPAWQRAAEFVTGVEAQLYKQPT
jgi:hypothetical protein